MKCPYCHSPNSFVKDSRDVEDGSNIRRRRYCQVCDARFTTVETVQSRHLWVIKKSGAKKHFEREKIYNSISTAMRKRNISENVIDEITNRIVANLENNKTPEIPTSYIGELIMQELAKIDYVSYVRFASVYKEFSDTEDFIKLIATIEKR